MGLWSGLGKIGMGAAGIALSPFSFGTSLALAAPGLAGGVHDLFSGGGGGGAKPSPTSGAGGTDLNSLLSTATADRTAAKDKAAGYADQSNEMLQPIMDYFKALTGGDPNAALQATMPERARVIDQYDTARQAISQFTPRGGGQASTLTASRFAEARDLSNVTNTAVTQGRQQQAQLATYLASLGLNEQQIASQDLNTIISAILNKESLDLTKRGQNMSALSSAGEGIGTLLGLYLTRGAGKGTPA